MKKMGRTSHQTSPTGIFYNAKRKQKEADLVPLELAASTFGSELPYLRDTDSYVFQHVFCWRTLVPLELAASTICGKLPYLSDTTRDEKKDGVAISIDICSSH